MIIILEGCSGSGKTTKAQEYVEKGFQLVKGRFSIARAKQFLELNKDKDIVCDRLFITLSKNEKDAVLLEFNDWILERKYIVCYKLLTSIENTFSKQVKILPDSLKLKQAEDEHENYDRVFSIMSCFKLLQDLSDIKIWEAK